MGTDVVKRTKVLRTGWLTKLKISVWLWRRAHTLRAGIWRPCQPKIRVKYVIVCRENPHVLRMDNRAPPVLEVITTRLDKLEKRSTSAWSSTPHKRQPKSSERQQLDDSSHKVFDIVRLQHHAVNWQSCPLPFRNRFLRWLRISTLQETQRTFGKNLRRRARNLKTKFHL